MLQQTVSLVHDHKAHPARRVGVGVVGLGPWGADLLAMLGDSSDAEVRWICDLDTSRLAKYRRRYPDARVTTRPDRILADPGVDAIILTTPVDTHYELAMLALEAGKHAFLRGSLATSAELADDIATAARQGRRIVMCGQASLYSPPIRAVKRMIEAGTLGDIHFVSSTRSNLGLGQRSASVIWDLGPQDFSILLYWLSELPSSVRVLGRESTLAGGSDVAFVAMNFSSGTLANVELSWLSPSKLGRTAVVGSERTVVYEEGSSEPVRLFDCGVSDQVLHLFGDHHRPSRRGDIVVPNIEDYDPLELQLSEFLNAIRAGDLMEDHTMMARNVVRIAEASDESLRLGGTEVSLSDAEFSRALPARGGLAAV